MKSIFNIDLTKKKIDHNKKHILVTDLDKYKNKFLKNYYTNCAKKKYYKNYYYKIHDVITKEEFLSPHIKILTEKDAFEILYKILQSHNINPTIEIMSNIYKNKKNIVNPDVLNDFNITIKHLNLLHLTKLDKEIFESISMKETKKCFFYINSENDEIITC